MEKTVARAVELVMAAAQEATGAPNSRPWDYGWCTEEYRRSPDASFASPAGPLKLPPEGVTLFEDLHRTLAKNQRVKLSWNLDELWSILASLIGHVHATGESEEKVHRSIDQIIHTEPSLVVFPVANISWSGEPMRVGGKSLIGKLDDSFSAAIETLGGRGPKSKKAVQDYIESLHHREPRIGFATLVPGQGMLADAQARRNLEQLVDLSMLLLKDKESRNLWSLRGGTNRPGVRGLTLDWAAVNASLAESNDHAELYVSPLHIDTLGIRKQVSWRGEKPIPLWDILQDSALRRAVDLALTHDHTILRRLHVCSRWFSDSFWSSAEDDALLAAGVALDALVGAKFGLPGRAMKERFALLEPDHSMRAGRAKTFENMYSIRSKVAHGNEVREQVGSNILRDIQEAVTWAAWRIIRMYEIFSISSDEELDSIFDELRWGTRRWTTEPVNDSPDGRSNMAP